MNWHDNLIENDDEIRNILRSVKKIAVIGIKDESRPNEAAHMVPAYLLEQGYEILPVNPKFSSVFGNTCVDSIADIPGDIDLVLMFRAPGNIPPHASEVLGRDQKPAAVWMQSGIRNMDSAHRLATAGIKVVQDHCIYRDHLRLLPAHAAVA